MLVLHKPIIFVEKTVMCFSYCTIATFSDKMEIISYVGDPIKSQSCTLAPSVPVGVFISTENSA